MHPTLSLPENCSIGFFCATISKITCNNRNSIALHVLTKTHRSIYLFSVQTNGYARVQVNRFNLYMLEFCIRMLLYCNLVAIIRGSPESYFSARKEKNPINFIRYMEKNEGIDKKLIGN